MSHVKVGEAVCVERHYTIELGRDDFLALWRWESAQIERVSTLREVLVNIEGVGDVEYNPHFGPFVFYSVHADDDGPDVHAAVRGAIGGRILVARDSEL